MADETLTTENKSKKVWSILGTVLKWLALSFLVFVIVGNIVCLIKQRVKKQLVPTFCGLGLITVETGSMYPTIVPYEDIVLIKTQKNYKINDIVAFVNENGEAVTHRIVDVDDFGLYITQGDFNNTEDSKHLTNKDIFGKSVWIMKGAGRTLSFLQSPGGIVTMVIVGLIVIELPFAIKSIKENRERKKLKAQIEELENAQEGGEPESVETVDKNDDKTAPVDKK